MVKIIVCGMVPEIASGAAALLDRSSFIEVVAVLSDLDEVRSRIDIGDFDVCVVGINSFSWFDALSAHIHGRDSLQIRCVVAVPRTTSESLLVAIRCKANAVLDLGLPSDATAQILHNVASGRIDLTRNRSVSDLRELCPHDSMIRHCHDDLDVQILYHLLDGCSNEEIAKRSFVAVQTVRNRLVKLMAAGNVENRTQLVSRLVRS